MEWYSVNYPERNVDTSPNTIHSFYNLLLHLFLLILRKFQKVEEKGGREREGNRKLWKRKPKGSGRMKTFT